MEASERQQYIEGLINFIKWTSAIIIAAVLWIGNVIISISGYSRIFALISLFLLMISLFTAIYIVKQMVDILFQFWKAQGVQGPEEEMFHVMKSMGIIPKLVEMHYNLWIKVHIYTLFLGLVSYVCSVICTLSHC